MTAGPTLGTRATAQPTRWTARLKADVVRSIDAGEITREKALSRYALSDEELDGWIRQLRRAGERGLRARNLNTARPS